MAIPLDEAQLLAFFLEAFLYGVFFVLFLTMFFVLHYPDKMRHARRRELVTVGMVLLLLATAHLVIDFVRILQGFVFEKQYTNGANGYYRNIRHPLHISKTAIYVTQTLIGDSVIVWRLFIVFNRNWYVGAPAIVLLIGNAITGYTGTYVLTHATPTDSIFTYVIVWVTIYFVFTMILNTSCTVAIVYRIYATRRGLYTIRTLLPVTIAIVESGALYASGVLSVLIAYLLQSNGQYAALDAMSPLVGIVFALIVLQIHFHVGSQTTFAGQTSHCPRIPTNENMFTKDCDIPGRPVAVHIKHESQLGYPGIQKHVRVEEYWS